MSDEETTNDAATISLHMAGVEHEREINRLAIMIDRVPTTLEEFAASMTTKMNFGERLGEILSKLNIDRQNIRGQSYSDQAREAIKMAREKFGIAPTPPLPVKPITAGECEAIYKFLGDAAMVKLDPSSASSIALMLPRPQVVEAAENPVEDSTPIIDYIGVDQAAAMVNKSKRTLERRLSKSTDAPLPAVDGGGGKANEWQYLDLKPWLEREFGRVLPTRPHHVIR